MHPLDLRGDSAPGWRPQDLEDAKRWDEDYVVVQQQMQEMDFDAHLLELAADSKRGPGEGAT